MFPQKQNVESQCVVSVFPVSDYFWSEQTVVPCHYVTRVGRRPMSHSERRSESSRYSRSVPFITVRTHRLKASDAHKGPGSKKSKGGFFQKHTQSSQQVQYVAPSISENFPKSFCLLLTVTAVQYFDAVHCTMGLRNYRPYRVGSCDWDTRCRYRNP